MPTPVVMPQMGESITEGTVVRWLKKVGDPVERDEPLLEISTDKVDAEVPAPVGGVLLEVKVQEGETVSVQSVVATIGEAGASLPAGSAAEAAAEAPDTAEAGASSAEGRGLPRPIEVGSDVRGAAEPDTPRWFSPVVRRLARERDIDLGRIAGTGLGGRGLGDRVTKRDVLAFLGETPALGGVTAPSASPTEFHVERMSVMRRQIAERMVASRRVSAHAHSVFEVDFGRVAEIRRAMKARARDASEGRRLTYMPFIAKAVVEGLLAVPILNASVRDDSIIYPHDVNLGIAVALDWGLIVPVMKKAQELDLTGLSQAIADLADRARDKRLRVDEVQGGTFTITNQGVSGALLGTAIINQPQLGILAVGAIQKRPVVVDDAIVVRPMGYLTLGFDHRIIDGQEADRFLVQVKRGLEAFPEATD